MNRVIFKYIIQLVFIFVLQIIVLNNINLFDLLHPYLYLTLILILPINISRNGLLIIAFVIGFLMDVFCSTYGMHTSACVLLGLARIIYFKLILTEEIIESGTEPDFSTFGIRGFIIFIFIMVFVHHTPLYFIEEFRFSSPIYTFYKIFTNTIASVLIILIYDLLLRFKIQRP